MVSRRLAQGLAALTFSVGIQSQGTESCVETVTARIGDTCASLAEFAGIPVSQFLRSNPLVKSCDILVGGAVYCKVGTATTGAPTFPAGVPSSAAAAASTSSSGPLKTSRDGTCGGNVMCTGSRFGPCCSAHGFCGTSIDYCGEGCQAGLGQCGDVSSFSSERPAPNPSTANAVSIVTIVATSTVRVTDTVTTTLVTATAASTRASTLTTVTKTQTPPSKPSPTLPRTPNNCTFVYPEHLPLPSFPYIFLPAKEMNSASAFVL